MSRYWKITLTPLDAYFLGGERNASFSNSMVQLSERKPYFIRSNRMLSQSAAFGVLRYLGIQNPKTSFSISTSDKRNIGECSFSLTEDRSYGRIHAISSVLLTNSEGKRFVTAPFNRSEAGCDEDGIGIFRPFKSYDETLTMDGHRWLPEEYDEKNACDPSELICLENGDVLSSPFFGQIRTGINRASRRLAEQNADTPSGFFKKEFVVMRGGFSFLFYAETEEGFFVHTDSVAYIGQGRTPFEAHVERIGDKWDIRLPECCYPKERDWESATALSDLYVEGHTDDLRKLCSLMIAHGRSHRCMETNYKAKCANKRYTKKTALKLIPAGSCFLFCGEHRIQQLNEFRKNLQYKEPWNRARVAGFNCLTYSTDTKNGVN